MKCSSTAEVNEMTTLSGTCVCPGIVHGTIRRFVLGSAYTKQDIVVLDQWLTQDVLALKDAGALLSATGGVTSHASIVARELGIPALVNVETTKLAEGQHAMIDAADERVEVQ